MSLHVVATVLSSSTVNDIRIPKFLHELHGETAPLSQILLVYASALAGTVLFFIALYPYPLPLWKSALLAVLLVDIIGGVTANLSSSTNQYYQRANGRRIGFLLLHVLQPALFTLLFPEQWAYFAYVGVFALAAAFLVNSVNDPELQQNLGAALLVCGICAGTIFAPEPIALHALAPLFLTKLILGFAVRRPKFSRN